MNLKYEEATDEQKDFIKECAFVRNINPKGFKGDITSKEKGGILYELGITAKLFDRRTKAINVFTSPYERGLSVRRSNGTLIWNIIITTEQEQEILGAF